MTRIDYVELATTDIGASRDFLARAFGWGFVDHGPSYQAFADAGLDGGLDGSGERPPGAPLVILRTDDLETALAAVEAAGGMVTRATFAFPGGRRFHFREPGGNEMAVWSDR